MLKSVKFFNTNKLIKQIIVIKKKVCNWKTIFFRYENRFKVSYGGRYGKTVNSDFTI